MLPPLAGRATPDATERLRARSEGSGRVARGHFRQGPLELRLSSLGLGTYLGNPDLATDRAVEEAVVTCVGSGRVNVLDTAINYRYQRAERSIGRALRRWTGRGGDRAEIFVSSKVGYLAPDGESARAPRDWIQTELLDPGILRPEDIAGGSHAMTPRYLADQIERSRANLDLETIDLVYLHNPGEAQLEEVGRSEFLDRLRAAFGELERQRRSGTIGAYGVATWDSFRAAPGSPGYLSLAEVLAAADAAGGSAHGFRFVQLPYNLLMPEAATFANQGPAEHRRPLLDEAREHGVGVFTSVPLMQGRLVRAKTSGPPAYSAAAALQFVRSTPGVLAPLVGQKTAEHLSENLAVASLPPEAPWESRRGPSDPT